MRFIAKLVAVLVIGASQVVADIPVPANSLETLNRMAEAVRALPDGYSVTVDTENISAALLIGDITVTVYPDNLHANLLAAENDAESQAVFDHHISATFESIKRMVSNEVAIPKPESLLPVIRANILPVQQKTDDSLFRTEFAADMWTYLVIDGGRTIAYLLESQLAEMEMDQADVLDVAISNLEDTGWSPLFTPVSSSFASIFYLGEGNMFDSSLLLMNATKTELAKRFRRPVALLLAREIVLVADGSSPEDIETLQRVAQERFDQVSYPISQRLLELKKGSWEEFHEDQ